MTDSPLTIANVTCVAIAGRGVLIEGASGCGKSTLALELIDRGARLIGDDAVTLELHTGCLVAAPPPNIAGKLEIRGLGIADTEPVSAPLALVVSLDERSERLPAAMPNREWLGIGVPVVGLAEAMAHSWPLRVEWGLRMHGLEIAPLQSRQSQGRHPA